MAARLGTETVNEIADRPAVVGTFPPMERLAALLATRNPERLASGVLSTLIAEFGATAGSLFYATRPPLRLRQGECSELITAHLDQWEASIEQRIAAGPWRVAKQEELSLAWQPIRGTGQRAVYSLIPAGDRVAGTISLIYSRERLPSGSERDSLTHFLQASGQAVSLAAELILSKQRMSQLSLFYHVAQAMASTFDLEKILNDTLELTTAILDASASALILVDDEREELVFAYTHGEIGGGLHQRRVDLDAGIAGWVIARGQPVIANDVENDPRFRRMVDAWIGSPTRSVICVPIQIRGNTIGVLEAWNKRGESGFDAEDLSLMVTTTNQAAVAIENHQLYQDLRDEQERIIQAQEHVRRQVARNLHDGTVQFLSAISMSIDHLEQLLEIKPEAAKSELKALRDLARQATQRARLALFELRPLILETQGLVPAMEAYVQQLQDSEDFGVHLQVAPPLPEMNSSVAATVFAIVQEAVTNAKKHASPKDVWLRVSQAGGWLQVVIEDNGKGFALDAVQQGYDLRGSIGLLSMRERAELIDGSVEIQSSTTSPHAGTRVILRIPLSPPGGERPYRKPIGNRRIHGTTR